MVGPPFMMWELVLLCVVQMLFLPYIATACQGKRQLFLKRRRVVQMRRKNSKDAKKQAQQEKSSQEGEKISSEIILRSPFNVQGLHKKDDFVMKTAPSEEADEIWKEKKKAESKSSMAAGEGKETHGKEEGYGDDSSDPGGGTAPFSSEEIVDKSQSRDDHPAKDDSVKATAVNHIEGKRASTEKQSTGAGRLGASTDNQKREMKVPKASRHSKDSKLSDVEKDGKETRSAGKKKVEKKMRTKRRKGRENKENDIKVKKKDNKRTKDADSASRTQASTLSDESDSSESKSETYEGGTKDSEEEGSDTHKEGTKGAEEEGSDTGSKGTKDSEEEGSDTGSKGTKDSEEEGSDTGSKGTKDSKEEGSDTSKEGTRDSEEEATQRPEKISVEPTVLEWTGSESALKLTVRNTTGTRQAFKVNSSNIDSYKVIPKAGFIEQDAKVQLHVVRMPGISREDDSILIFNAEAKPDESNAEVLFNPKANYEKTVVPIRMV